MQARGVRRAICVLLLLVVALPGVAAFAQGPMPSDDEVNAIAKQLYCPVCENVPLDVCPTQACAQWRDTIRLKLSEGWSEQQIKQYFIDQYGGRVSDTPPATGFNWLAYLLPPLAFAAGAFLMFRAVRNMRREEHQDSALAEPVADDPYLSRLEEELRKRH